MNYSNLVATYKDKKVFLTGHTGFKGSWMLCLLHLLGANVKGYSLAPQNKEDHYNVINGDELCESVIADIRDKKKLEKEILNFQPDFIFHLAAQPLVRLSYEMPTETFEVNVIGTANILDSIRRIEKSCVSVIITTDKVYENKEWSYPYRESDRLGGYDPYSASKAAAELVVNSFRSSFFNVNDYNNHLKSIATARAGNVIGGGDWSKDRIIPDIVRALTKNEKIIVRNPNAVRPWQHVLEPISGYLHLASKMIEEPTKFSEAWNFGPNIEDNLTVKDIVESAIKIYGKGTFYTPPSENNLHEANLLKLDISKTINELKWHPKWTSYQAIQKTLEWYIKSNNYSKDLTTNQINMYLNS